MPGKIDTLLLKNKSFIVFIAAYGCLLFALLPMQSLWVDELMQTMAVRDSTLSKLLTEEIPRTAGQVPLAYLEQKLSIAALGYSTFSARFPAALMAIIAGFGVFYLAQFFAVKKGTCCCVVFATLPLQLRYATEARPYSQALCISTWLTVIFLKIREAPTPLRLLADGSLLIIGLYTQPFTVFVAIAHCVYALCGTSQTKRLSLLTRLAVVVSVAILLFLPWYIFAKRAWANDVTGSNLHFRMQGMLPLLIVRELSGAGYLGGLMLISLSIYALRSSAMSFQRKFLLVLLIAVPAGLVVFTDAVFDYFFAVRQLIFILPPLAILAWLGIEALYSNGRKVVAVMSLTILTIVNVSYCIRWFTKPREDWERVASYLNAGNSRQACLILVPPESITFYNFYRPKLHVDPCDLNTVKSVYVAVSPYARSKEVVERLLQNLAGKGLRLISSDREHEPETFTFDRL